LILLGIACLQLTLFVAAQGPKHPESKRRGGATKAPDKSSKWSREQKRDNVKRGPERNSVESKTGMREASPGGRGRARDKASAWEQSRRRAEAGRPTDGKSLESKPTERDKRFASGRGVDKASRWNQSQTQKARELRPTQRPQLLEHVFRGELKKGNARGFHYEGARMEAAYGTKVIENTRTAPDAHGVYRAMVQVRGVAKVRESSFFPHSWSRADVVKAINEAHAKAAPVVKKSPNYLEGISSRGVIIGMYTNKHGEVVTAFPIYQTKKN
jgi:hypothetical protein